MTTIANLLVEVGADISGLGSGLTDASNKIDNFGTRAGNTLSNMGSSLTGLGAQFTAITAPIALAGAAGINLASTFQNTMTELSARTGIVGDDLAMLSDFALQMGADTAFSGQQAADALLQLITSGSSATEAMALLPTVMDAAAASGEALGVTADTVTDIMASFGLPVEAITPQMQAMMEQMGVTDQMMTDWGNNLIDTSPQLEALAAALGMTVDEFGLLYHQGEDAASVVDSLAKAAGASSADMASLGQGFANVGGVAKTFGLSVNRTAAVLALFSENGIKGAEAGTALKSLLLNMSRDTDETVGAWNELGVSLYDTEGNMRDFAVVMSELDTALDGLPIEDQNRLMQDLAGSYGIVGLTALRGGMSIEEMETAMAGSASASEVADARMNTFSGAVDSLKGSFETLMITALTPFMDDVLTPMVQSITDVVNGITAWVEENPELTSTIVGIGAALLTVGPILAGIGIALGAAGTAVTALSTALGLLLSPIGIAVAAGAALVLAYETNFMGLKDTVDNVFGGIKTTIEGIFGGGKGEIDGSKIGVKNMGAEEQSEPLQMLAAGLSEALSTIETVVTTVWTNIQPGITALQEGITGFFAAFESTDTEGLDGAVGGIVGFIGGLVEAAANIGSQVFSALLENIGNALPMIGQGISDFVSAISALGVGDTEGGLIGLGDVITDFVNALLDFAQIEVEIPDFSDALEGWNQFFTDLGIIIDFAVTWIEDRVNDIAVGIRTLIRDITEIATTAQVNLAIATGDTATQATGAGTLAGIDIAKQTESAAQAYLNGQSVNLDIGGLQWGISGEADPNTGAVAPASMTAGILGGIADQQAIAEAARQAVAAGDLEAAQTFVPVALKLSDDPRAELQDLMQTAIETGGEDGGMFNMLVPMATELGIDSADLVTQVQTAMDNSITGQHFGVSPIVDINVIPGSVVFDAQNLSGAIAGTVGAGVQVGGGGAVPMLASGGDIAKEGLAYLHSGEKVLNPAETAAYNAGLNTTNNSGGNVININGTQDVDALLFELKRRGIDLGAMN